MGWGDRDRVGGEIYTRNPCGISFRSFTEREPQAAGDSGGGGKGKKGWPILYAAEEKKGCEQRAAEEKRRWKKGWLYSKGHEEKKRGEAKGVDNTYPSSLLQRFSLLCFEHSRITLRASKQASKQATSSQLLNVIKSTHPSHRLLPPSRVA